MSKSATKYHFYNVEEFYPYAHLDEWSDAGNVRCWEYDKQAKTLTLQLERQHVVVCIDFLSASCFRFHADAALLKEDEEKRGERTGNKRALVADSFQDTKALFANAFAEFDVHVIHDAPRGLLLLTTTTADSLLPVLELRIRLQPFQMTVSKFITDGGTQRKQVILQDYDDNEAERKSSLWYQPIALQYQDEQRTEYAMVNIKKRPASAKYFGFGEMGGVHLAKNGASMTFFNHDNMKYGSLGIDGSGPEDVSVPLYHSSPFFMEVNAAEAYCYGLFLNNTAQTFMNMGYSTHRNASDKRDYMDDRYYLGTLYNDFDYFFFLGETCQDILAQFTTLTGRSKVKPRYALGYHQGCYGYDTKEKVMAVARTYRAHKIPIDGIHIDIDIQDAYRTFTVSEQRFSNVEHMFDDLKALGFKCSTNITPIISIRPDEQRRNALISYRALIEGVKHDCFIHQRRLGDSLDDIIDNEIAYLFLKILLEIQENKQLLMSARDAVLAHVTLHSNMSPLIALLVVVMAYKRMQAAHQREQSKHIAATDMKIRQTLSLLNLPLRAIRELDAIAEQQMQDATLMITPQAINCLLQQIPRPEPFDDREWHGAFEEASRQIERALLTPHDALLRVTRIVSKCKALNGETPSPLHDLLERLDSQHSHELWECLLQMILLLHPIQDRENAYHELRKFFAMIDDLTVNPLSDMQRFFGDMKALLSSRAHFVGEEIRQMLMNLLLKRVYYIGAIFYGNNPFYPTEDLGTSGVLPDFGSKRIRLWWGVQYNELCEHGLEMIWQDMTTPALKEYDLQLDNQTTIKWRTFPPDLLLLDNHVKKYTHQSSQGQRSPFAKIHNLYSYNLHKATFHGLNQIQVHSNKRNFIIGRGGFAGLHRYAGLWTGDNGSNWQFLRITLPQIINLGLSAESFCGADVGGFESETYQYKINADRYFAKRVEGDQAIPDPELLMRWTMLGAFLPWFRNHYNGRYKQFQEPYAYQCVDPRVLPVCKHFIELRYQLLQLFYDAMHENARTGIPIVRPLFLHDHDGRLFDDDMQCFLDTEFLVGKDLLIAPFLEQRPVRRDVYLPKGSRWYQFQHNRYPLEPPYDGGTLIKNYDGHLYFEVTENDEHLPVLHDPKHLDFLMPMYVREGAVLPMLEVEQYVGERNRQALPHPLTLTMYPGSQGEYTLYLDDGYTRDFEEIYPNLPVHFETEFFERHLLKSIKNQDDRNRIKRSYKKDRASKQYRLFLRGSSVRADYQHLLKLSKELQIYLQERVYRIDEPVIANIETQISETLMQIEGRIQQERELQRILNDVYNTLYGDLDEYIEQVNKPYNYIAGQYAYRITKVTHHDLLVEGRRIKQIIIERLFDRYTPQYEEAFYVALLSQNGDYATQYQQIRLRKIREADQQIFLEDIPLQEINSLPHRPDQLAFELDQSRESGYYYNTRVNMMVIKIFDTSRKIIIEAQYAQ